MALPRSWPRACALAAAGAAFTLAMTVPASAQSLLGVTFEPGPIEQEYEVPAGTFKVRVEAVGAPGDPGVGVGAGAGGSGAGVVSTLNVTPGQPLYVYVGRRGGGGRAAGYPGMESGAGGGASEVRSCKLHTELCSTPQTIFPNRLVVAGGGGGGGASGGDDGVGGDGGGTNADGNGSHGGDAATIADGAPGGGGRGGTSSGGGAGGESRPVCRGGNFADRGVAFDGGGGGAFSTAGGGGGDGYYGGGGGGGGDRGSCASLLSAGGGGGGGGSSFGPAGTRFDPAPGGTAHVRITPLEGPGPNHDPPVATIASPADGGVYTLGQDVDTSFWCAESVTGPGIASCLDDRNAQAPTSTLDTSTAGPRTYAVRATSKSGKTAIASITYVVVARPPAKTTPGLIRPPVKPATQPAVRDSVASIRGTQVRVKGRSARLTIRCAGTGDRPCRGRLLLTAKLGKRRITLGRTNYRVAPSSSRTVLLRLARSSRAALGRVRTRPLRAVATVISADGSSARRSVTLSLRR